MHDTESASRSPPGVVLRAKKRLNLRPAGRGWNETMPDVSVPIQWRRRGRRSSDGSRTGSRRSGSRRRRGPARTCWWRDRRTGARLRWRRRRRRRRRSRWSRMCPAKVCTDHPAGRSACAGAPASTIESASAALRFFRRSSTRSLLRAVKSAGRGRAGARVRPACVPSLQEQPEIQPQRPALHVVQIELHHSLEIHRVADERAPEADDAGPHLVAQPLPRHERATPRPAPAAGTDPPATTCRAAPGRAPGKLNRSLGGTRRSSRTTGRSKARASSPRQRSVAYAGPPRFRVVIQIPRPATLRQPGARRRSPRPDRAWRRAAAGRGYRARRPGPARRPGARRASAGPGALRSPTSPARRRPCAAAAPPCRRRDRALPRTAPPAPAGCGARARRRRCAPGRRGRGGWVRRRRWCRRRPAPAPGAPPACAARALRSRCRRSPCGAGRAASSTRRRRARRRRPAHTNTVTKTKNSATTAREMRRSRVM